MDRQKSLMDLVDSIRRLDTELNLADGENRRNELDLVCFMILDGSISGDLAAKMAKLLNRYSSSYKKGMIMDGKSE